MARYIQHIPTLEQEISTLEEENEPPAEILEQIRIQLVNARDLSRITGQPIPQHLFVSARQYQQTVARNVEQIRDKRLKLQAGKVAQAQQAIQAFQQQLATAEQERDDAGPGQQEQKRRAQENMNAAQTALDQWNQVLTYWEDPARTMHNTPSENTNQTRPESSRRRRRWKW
ncbi:MAG: hypothetical protein Q9162_002079 [Coniocarpon cinnabarinum]